MPVKPAKLTDVDTLPSRRRIAMVLLSRSSVDRGEPAREPWHGSITASWVTDGIDGRPSVSSHHEREVGCVTSPKESVHALPPEPAPSESTEGTGTLRKRAPLTES